MVKWFESCSKGVFHERRKVLGIEMFFVGDKSDKMKVICLNCKEKVRIIGVSNPKNFNPTNLGKNLTNHKEEFYFLLMEEMQHLKE